MTRDSKKQIALLVYPGCSLLELVGAQHVWATASLMSNYETVVVGPTTDFINSNTSLSFRPQRTFAEVPEPHLLMVIGGGQAAQHAASDEALLAYVRHAAQGASIVGSTSTGSLILAAAGVLEGKRATTHWAFQDGLEALGVHYLRAPWVEDGKFITGAGSSSAVDISAVYCRRPQNDGIHHLRLHRGLVVSQPRHA